MGSGPKPVTGLETASLQGRYLPLIYVCGEAGTRTPPASRLGRTSRALHSPCQVGRSLPQLEDRPVALYLSEKWLFLDPHFSVSVALCAELLQLDSMKSQEFLSQPSQFISFSAPLL